MQVFSKVSKSQQSFFLAAVAGLNYALQGTLNRSAKLLENVLKRQIQLLGSAPLTLIRYAPLPI